MTDRTKIATQILAALIIAGGGRIGDRESQVKRAYSYADQLLLEVNKR